MLDLLLISSSPIEFPLRPAMLSQPQYLLGVILSHSKLEGSVVAVDKERWNNFRETGNKKRALTGEIKRVKYSFTIYTPFILIS